MSEPSTFWHEQNTLFPFPSQTLPIPISQAREATNQLIVQAFNHPTNKAANQASKLGIAEAAGSARLARSRGKKFEQAFRELPQHAEAKSGHHRFTGDARLRHFVDPEFPTLTFADLRFLSDLGVRWS